MFCFSRGGKGAQKEILLVGRWGMEGGSGLLRGTLQDDMYARHFTLQGAMRCGAPSAPALHCVLAHTG